MYVIGFIHPISGSIILLSRLSNIDNICYNKEPKLPGTSSPEYAKHYIDVDTAKSDIYKLRYHFRDFIKIKTCIIHTDTKEADGEDKALNSYKFSELKSL